MPIAIIVPSVCFKQQRLEGNGDLPALLTTAIPSDPDASGGKSFPVGRGTIVFLVSSVIYHLMRFSPLPVCRALCSLFISFVVIGFL